MKRSNTQIHQNESTVWRFTRKMRLMTVLGLFFAGIAASPGDTVLSALSVTSAGGAAGIVAGWERAQGFTTGDGSWQLDSFTFELSRINSNPEGLEVSLYSDDAGKPGELLSSLAGDVPTDPGTYTYYDAGYTLTENTAYWVVLSAPTTGNVQWLLNSTTDSDPGFPMDGWSMNGNANTMNGGAAWTLVSTTDTRFALAATSVPEPSALLLLGISALAFGCRRRFFSRLRNGL